MDDVALMRRALALAVRARGRTAPNPMVGAVVCRDGEIVGEGYHRQAGKPHAEVAALVKAGPRARGATLVVNLEPCNHHGRTPPCTDLIIREGVRRVVAAIEDPNPLVRGAGFARLRESGIEVEAGVLADEATWANRAYIKAQTLGIPWVEVKIACTLDGKLATASGKSKYLTSEQSRRVVHRLRAEADAVVVGSGTIRADDPLLNCRLTSRKIAPGVVILDSMARTPTDSRLFSVRRRRPVVVAVGADAPRDARSKLSQAGAEVWDVGGSGRRHLPWGKLLRRCCQEGVYHLLVEGGAEVFTSLLREGLADRLSVFVAPLMIGADGLDSIGSLGVVEVKDAWRFCLEKARRTGPDVMLELAPQTSRPTIRIPEPGPRRSLND